MPAPSHGYSGTHRGEGPLGFSERTFNVVAHLMSQDTGGTRAMQGLHARSTEELVAEVERRLEHGFRVVDADVYNEFLDAYQPLRAADFPHLPSNLELALRVARTNAGRNTDDWTAGDGGMSFDQRRRARFGDGSNLDGRDNAADGPDLRRQIVDRTRALFLPYFNRHQITKAEMAEACTDILSRFAAERGLGEEQLAATHRAVTLPETDMLRRLSFEYTMERGFDKRQPAHHHAANDVSARRGTHAGYGYDDYSAGVGARVRDPSGVMGARAPTPTSARRRNASPAAGVRKPAFGSTASRFAGGAGGNSPTRNNRNAALLRHQRHHHRLSPTAANVAWADQGRAAAPAFRNEPETGFYYPTGRRRPSPTGTNTAELGPHATHPSYYSGGGGGGGTEYSPSRVGHMPPPPGRPGAGAMDDAGGANVSSVSYTVAGHFPNEPRPANADGPPAPGELRTVLSPPAIAAADDDVVITAAIHSSSPTSLCWWLGYGPSQIVLNLDKLYANGMVTTFQVSENAVVLTIRGGTLVPGWDYSVHLDVTENATGRLASAQTRFKVPGTAAPGGSSHNASRSSNAMLAPPGIGSAVDLDARRAEYIRDKRSATNAWFGAGYAADGERGALNRRGQVADASPPGTVTSVVKKPAADMGTSTAGGAGTPPRQVMIRDTNNNDGAATHATADGSTKPQGTYQEQLRDFFVQQVEPLYYLSANPSLSEQAFKAAVRGVSKEYWFARANDAALTDDLKREIVRDVKLAVARAREEGGGAVR